MNSFLNRGMGEGRVGEVKYGYRACCSDSGSVGRVVKKVLVVIGCWYTSRSLKDQACRPPMRLCSALESRGGLY